ncbi:ANTAR domain-containing protein [Streptomyces sp. TLI_185]|uniref:ANTAR domain-containing protein n=1 Tax=Streptomyces sp. TLI_185 TaxID=2485151 RepID=UPI000F4EE6E7|nr:ANTAR domain-containing protein [Streptomyces sp. TLI_185]RPF37800.1 anti-anti-sigma factor [Streptomyces sp. TLI_185]
MSEPAQSAQTCLVTIDVVPDGDRMYVRVCGELDHGGRQLERGLDEALNSSASGIDLDLSAIGFCDCSGLNLLLGLRRKALDEGKTVTICASGPSVDRLLALTGARELFVHPVSEAGSAEPDTAGDSLKSPDAVDQELRKEVAELRRAMQTRPSIDLARGILMASFSLSPEVAWTVLVTASQNTNTKLHRLAEDLVGTVQGTPLPEDVQQQLAAAVAQARAAAPLA